MITRKKAYTEHDAYEEFTGVLTRSKFTEFMLDNNILICKKNKKSTVFVLGDQLNLLFRNDPIYIVKTTTIPNNTDNVKLINIAKYENDTWIDLDGKKLYNGEIINLKIDINGYEVDIDVNKGLFPCRLLKKDYKDISYRIDTEYKIPSLVLRKIFKNKLEGFDFTLLQVYQVI